MVDHLGYEHRFIAEALGAGRGFADPFGEPTGPTAWVAPLLPTLQALLLSLGGIRLATIAIVILQDLTLILTGWLVLLAAARTGWSRAPAIGLMLFYATTWFHFISCYQYTHDTWLIMFWVTALVYLADRLRTGSVTRRRAAWWGLVGGLAVLSSPVLGPVWVALTALVIVASGRVKPFLMSALVTMAVMAPWIARNEIVFGRFVPVKSNLSFEFYQSNALERNGVLLIETLYTHPFLDNGTERTRYRELGEMAYLDECRTRCLEIVRSDPTGYLLRMKNRLLSATLNYHAPSRDQGKLRTLVCSLIYPLPFLGIVLVVMTRGWARNSHTMIALVVYVTYLTPYILVAYYGRYGMPLLGLRVMFEVAGLDALRILLGGSKQA